MKTLKQFLQESDAPVNVSAAAVNTGSDPGNARQIEFPDRPLGLKKSRRLPPAAKTLLPGGC